MRKVLLYGVPGIVLGTLLFNHFISAEGDNIRDPVTESQGKENITNQTEGKRRESSPSVVTDGTGQVFSLHFGLKAEFDLFIFEQESVAPDALVAAYRTAVLKRDFTSDSQAYLIDLFSRYVNYKVQLETLDEQSGSQDISAIANRLEARDDLRHTFFTQDEYHYLFSKDAQYDDAALARLRIASDTSLSDEEKQRLIEEQLAMLPADQRASFTPSLEVNRINLLSNTYDNPEARYQAIAAEFGHDVAQRMRDKEQAQDNWKERVTAFQQWQESVMSSSLSPEQIREKITSHRNQHFTENEQRRLRVFLENPALLGGQ